MNEIVSYNGKKITMNKAIDQMDKEDLEDSQKVGIINWFDNAE